MLDNVQKVLLVYNLEKLTDLKNKDVKYVINKHNYNNKFVVASVIKVHLPEDEAKTEETIRGQRYYLPHKYVQSSEVLLNYDEL